MRVEPETIKLHKDSFVADLHADPLMWNTFGYDIVNESEPLLPMSALYNHTDIPRLRRGGVDLQAFGIVTDVFPTTKRSAERQLKRLADIIFQDDGLDWALSADDAEFIKSEGRLGIFAALEGVRPLAGKIKNLEHFYDLGVRYCGLAHFKSTEAAYSSFLPWKLSHPFPSS